MVEEGDLDDKLEDKATNEVVDDVKKVAMEGVDKERKQVAMKVANTNCLDDLIDNALLLLFLLLDCRICIKRGRGQKNFHPKKFQKKISPKKFSKKNFTKTFSKKFQKKKSKKKFQQKKN